MKYSRIEGTGGYLPENVLTNADLEKMVDTSDQWIRERTGIEKRHIAVNGQTTCDLAEPAARAAVELYGWQLAAALAAVMNVIDPDAIVLGGGVSKLQALYAVVPERWGAFVFSECVTTPLERARHGDSGGVRGAAWLGRDARVPNGQDRS